MGLRVSYSMKETPQEYKASRVVMSTSELLESLK